MSWVSEANFVSAVRVDAVESGKALAFDHCGRSILICNSGGLFFAVENKCSHADEPLACGRIRNGWIACPSHGARFDLETGKAMNPPAKDPIITFPLRVVDDMIEVAV
jgi:3-phenylpropionate/trans-cinnamate dioxygenase ferredoxin component